MSYDKGLVDVQRVTGGALTGWSAITSISSTGETTETRTPARFAAVSIQDGYTVGDAGELSLDPATGTATVTDYVTVSAGGDPSFGAGEFGAGAFGMPAGGLELPPVNLNDRIEISYDGTLILAALVTECTVSFATSADAMAVGQHVERQTSISLSSIQRLMLDTTVAWLSLPEERAITRLRRWFTVDTTAVTDASVLDVRVPAEDAGSATLLDLARAFSEVTRLALRPPAVLDPDTWPNLTIVVPASTPAAGLDDAAEFVTAIEYTNGRPTGLTVKADDTRFADAGFRVPGTVDALGRRVVAHRLSQTFSTTYSAALEVS